MCVSFFLFSKPSTDWTGMDADGGGGGGPLGMWGSTFKRLLPSSEVNSYWPELSRSIAGF